ncbi:Type IV pilus assembly protein PilO [Planktothrix tepida]|uniref:Type IV pilus assembly protein PilO n=2 Tax=Planktothrix TaxID=54304 RepID=A0A1J1LFV7_9CYAN|nr:MULTISPECIES: pilus assembly protein PilO [Planktothrix]CAD5927104.1 Type IV pilus assembly protein PilO [Planktothrix tepida]CAD5980878.1 Type IV pilus assembly protein PilO [Planktothrix pseudagardhii]CUR31336.1 Type IV pilus assembly protein PilO [Planktothrix tepida PCC 9214]
MTVANEFIQDVDGEGGGPVIFGIALTPKIMGIGAGVVGAILAGFLIYQFLLPTLAEGQTLRDEIKTKQDEIEKQDQRLRERAKAEKELADAKVRRATVTALFADETSLETLLFDINEQINKINAGIIDDSKRAKLSLFTPVVLDKPEAEIVNDGSLGPDVNGKLRRRAYKVEFEGSFEQTLKFLASLERLQPLLVVRGLKSSLKDQTQTIEGEYRQGKFVPSANQPQRRLKTAFELQVLLPLSPEQAKAAVEAAKPAETPAEPPK